jgi:predicted phosphoribosyltransferase
VPVAYEVAQSLGAPLDIFVVRKLGVPGHAELAMGALASGGLVVVNDDVVRNFAVTKHDILEAARAENREIGRRDRAYRGDLAPIHVAGNAVILIDDGLATGASMRAAIRALRQRSPARIIAAVPVAAPDCCSEMADEADDVICAMTPGPFHAVGLWYEDFSPTSDDEVRELLAAARNLEEAQRAARARAS